MEFWPFSTIRGYQWARISITHTTHRKIAETINKKVLMENNLYNHLKEQFPDVKHLIRSIQLIEGNPDCFGKSNGSCERQDCIWLEYCLKEK